jgi:hypothetical protein
MRPDPDPLSLTPEQCLRELARILLCLRELHVRIPRRIVRQSEPAPGRFHVEASFPQTLPDSTLSPAKVAAVGSSEG